MGQDRARRVVRGVQQDQAGARGDGGAQFVQVEGEGPGVRAQGDGDAYRAGHRDAGRVRVVVRLQGDDLVTRFEEGEERGRDGLGGAGRDQDLGVRVVGEAVEALLVRGDRGAQLGDAGARRVLVAEAREDRAGGRLGDFGGAVGVGEALAQVDRPGAGGQRRHLREDRGAEGRQTAVEEGAVAAHGCAHGRHPGGNLWTCSSVLWAAWPAGIPLHTGRGDPVPREDRGVREGAGLVFVFIVIGLLFVAFVVTMAIRSAGSGSGSGRGSGSSTSSSWWAGGGDSSSGSCSSGSSSSCGGSSSSCGGGGGCGSS